MRNKNYRLVQSLSELSSDEVMVILAESERLRNKPKIEVPAEKINSLLDRWKTLVETTQIRFSVDISGVIELDLDWDETCYVRKYRFIPNEGCGAGTHNEYIKKLLNSCECGIYTENDKIKKLGDSVRTVLDEIESLADEYDVSFDDLYDEIIYDGAKVRASKRGKRAYRAYRRKKR